MIQFVILLFMVFAFLFVVRIFYYEIEPELSKIVINEQTLEIKIKDDFIKKRILMSGSKNHTINVRDIFMEMI